MKFIVDAIEIVSACVLGVAVLLVFLEAVLRHIFGVQIPDSFTLSGLLQGIAIFWGIAVTTYAGSHITVDLLYEKVSEPVARRIEIFATLVAIFCFLVLAWMLGYRLERLYASGERTQDLILPIWPFVTFASLGIVAAAVLGAIRCLNLAKGRSLKDGTHVG